MHGVLEWFESLWSSVRTADEARAVLLAAIVGAFALWISNRAAIRSTETMTTRQLEFQRAAERRQNIAQLSAERQNLMHAKLKVDLAKQAGDRLTLMRPEDRPERLRDEPHLDTFAAIHERSAILSNLHRLKFEGVLLADAENDPTLLAIRLIADGPDDYYVQNTELVERAFRAVMTINPKERQKRMRQSLIEMVTLPPEAYGLTLGSESDGPVQSDASSRTGNDDDPDDLAP